MTRPLALAWLALALLTACPKKEAPPEAVPLPPPPAEVPVLEVVPVAPPDPPRVEAPPPAPPSVPLPPEPVPIDPELLQAQQLAQQQPEPAPAAAPPPPPPAPDPEDLSFAQRAACAANGGNCVKTPPPSKPGETFSCHQYDERCGQSNECCSNNCVNGVCK